MSKTEAMLQHQETVKKENEKKIVKAVKALKKDGNKVSVSAVAKRANVTRQTVYRCEKAMALINEGREQRLNKNTHKIKTKSQTQIIKELKEQVDKLEQEKAELIQRLIEKEEENITLTNGLAIRARANSKS